MVFLLLIFVCVFRFMLNGTRRSKLPHYIAAEPVNHPLASERNEYDLAGLAGFEPHRRTGGDIEPRAT